MRISQEIQSKTPKQEEGMLNSTKKTEENFIDAFDQTAGSAE